MLETSTDFNFLYEMLFISGGPAGQPTGAPTHKGRYDVTRIIGNTVRVNSGFPRAKEIFQKLHALLALALRNAYQACRRVIKLKECRFCVWRGVANY
jgi:hypothetical protein